MSNNPRDTQFKGFAEALFCDLPWNDINIDMDTDGWEERWEALIARRAYDLVVHTLEHAPLSEYIALPEDIPDLPELPKEPES